MGGGEEGREVVLCKTQEPSKCSALTICSQVGGCNYDIVREESIVACNDTDGNRAHRLTDRVGWLLKCHLDVRDRRCGGNRASHKCIHSPTHTLPPLHTMSYHHH